MDPQPENIWLSIARLPALSSFPVSPWEHRHRQELALREELYSTYSDRQHPLSKNDSNQSVLNSEFLTSNLPQAQGSTFQLTSIREADFVSRCLYALQGIPVAVKELQLLAKLFSGQVADRSLHRIPSLWQRSSSTKALGKLLIVFAQAGWVRCQLEEFVHYFLNLNTQEASISQLHTDFQRQTGSSDSRQRKKGKKKNKNWQKANASSEEELKLSPPYSLVNQAFAKSVKSILQGHLAALNTLTESVLRRRSTNDSLSGDLLCSDEHVGAVIGLPTCDTTLLELHLHTHVLRIQLQALASVCLCKGSAEAAGFQEWDELGEWSAEREFVVCEKSSGTLLDFTSFPRGADLLTFLYKQLQEADNVHIELLRYLFSCACQPYLVFIHSWLYRATIRDPYKEFVVQEANLAGAGSGSQVKASVSTPCFLEDVCIALIRSGQQLQVLSKLVDKGVAEATSDTTSCFSNGFKMLETALKAWTELAKENSVFFPFLIFNKEELNELVKERKQQRHNVMQEFDLLFSNLHLDMDGSRSQAMSKLTQVNTQSVAPDMDVVTLKPYIDQNLAEVWRSSRSKGNPREVKESQEHEHILMASQINSECLSHLASREEAFGLKGRKEETQQHELGSSDFLNKREIMEVEQTVSIAAEGRPFSTNPNRENKQRKRWIEPIEVVVLHGQPDEEVSSHQQPAEENLDFYLCDYEVESGTLCNKLAETDYLDIAQSHPYSLPPCAQASLCSDMDLKCQGARPALQFLALARSHYSNSSSFFFSNICLEEVGPDIFGRSYIHKLAQNYKSSSLPQSDSYKKSSGNFHAVSQKFWSFEDCICDGSSYTNLLPSFFFTSSSSAVEALSFDNKSVLLHSEDQNDWGKSKAEGQLFLGGRKNPPNFTAATTMCSHPPLKNSKAEPSINFRAETPLEKLEGDKVLELSHTSQRSQGVASGGATWQSYLGLRGNQGLGSGSFPVAALESSEVPLEVIVEKCIIQEVLLQYQCISHFSVRLFHEVFGLQDHLAALRRYYFMERGDWADIFASALYHHAWYPTGSLQRQLEVQVLLEAAVQNSSCQEDDYAERLHVSVEKGGEDTHSNTTKFGHIYINKTTLSAFDFISLGYRLEWPISLIITSESLKLYNSTFNFLIRVKLAAHSVSDIWRFLKDLLHVPRKGDTSQTQDWLNTLMVFRQQIDHFVTTLQGHLETQLLQNVWRKFLLALRNEGKDLLDLETIHGLYLQDALYVCFLSEDMKPVKTHIDNIMQCLLDLSAYLNILGKLQNGKATLKSDKVQSAIFEAKTCFESSIQQIFQIALTRHNHFALSQFWTRLNFNGFFGSQCSKYS